MPDLVTRLNAALEGRYRIERELGEGGMATVYLAEDLKHNRKVALKVLKPELAAVVGAERFLAEIQVTANLQHPHILPLFDSGEADNFLFYVMPYVEGETLQDRIDREKQLPVDEAVALASKVAGALQHAHEHGVIHRDIKPGNILLQGGEPVVSDFGIALAVGAAGSNRLTETGLSLGTPYYMSPEQATGDQVVGASTDTYALGSVLYEMLVGEPPYPGTTAQAVLGKIIAGKPVSASEHRPSIPANVDAAIRKALEKLSADRFTAARDFAKALSDSGFRHGEEPAVGVGAGRGLWHPLQIATTGLALVLALGFVWLLLRPASMRNVARFEVMFPDTIFRSLPLVLSPDGMRMASGGFGSDGIKRVYVRELAQFSYFPIPGTEGLGNHVEFSPDGQSIAFSGQGRLRTVPVTGGPPVTLVLESVPDTDAGIAWGPDGMIYFRKSGQGMWRVPESGGDQEELTTLSTEERGHSWPDALPNGKGILFTVLSSGAPAVAVLSLETGESRHLFEGNVARYAQSGHIVYTSAEVPVSLLAVPFDADRLQVTGPSRPIMEGLARFGTGWSDFALSDAGDLAYRASSSQGGGVLVWRDRDGSEEALDAALTGLIRAPVVSPDGRKIAFEYTPVGEAGENIWIYDLGQETVSRLTFDGLRNINPFWNPEGTEVGFSSDRDGFLSLYSRPVDLSRDARLLVGDSTGPLYEASWTPDGEGLVYRWGTGGNEDLWYAALDSTPVVLIDTPFRELNPAVSPDGRWLAYQSDESGRLEVYVRSVQGSGGRAQVSTEGGTNPVWARNGGGLFYLDTSDLWYLTVATVRIDPDFAVESRERLASWESYAAATNGTCQRQWDTLRD